MKLPIPQRGQPFDVSLISNIITSINELWDNLVVNVSNYASIFTIEGRKSIRLTEVKLLTGTQTIESQTFSAGSNKAFQYIFDMPFLFPPVVTATVQSGTGAAYPVITSISDSRVDGIIVFPAKLTASVTVNIIAIGQAQ
jgi:hypothetical protein